MSPTKNKNVDFSKIKVIGFDLDQTLYPKSPEIDQAIQIYLYREISKFLNIKTEKAKRLFSNIYKNGKGLSGSKTLIKLGFSEGRARNMVQEALENANIANFLEPNKEVEDLLEKLKSKYVSLDILTGSNTKNALLKIAHLKIPTNTFSHILTADHASKSDLSLYQMWLDLYPQLKPENFLYIGDRVLSDFEKPKELRIRSILVNINEPDLKIDCLQLKSLVEIENYL